MKDRRTGADLGLQSPSTPTAFRFFSSRGFFVRSGPGRTFDFGLRQHDNHITQRERTTTGGFAVSWIFRDEEGNSDERLAGSNHREP